MSDIIIIPQIKESEQYDHFIELDCLNPEESIVPIPPIKECRKHDVTVNVEDLKKLVEAAKQDIGGQLTSLATKKEVQDLSDIIHTDVASIQYVLNRDAAIESLVHEKEESVKSFVLALEYATLDDVNEQINAIPKYTAGDNVVIKDDVISVVIPDTVASKEYVLSRESVIESLVNQKDEAIKSFVLEYVDGQGFLVASDIENKLDRLIFLDFSDELSSSIQEISQKQVELEKLTVIPIVDCTNVQDTNYMLSPNKKYIFGTKSTLTITLELPTDTTIVNHYYFEFISGSTATTLSLPASIKWTTEPSIKPNKTYLISIENNLGVIQEWT